jgi:hypothetical protein
MSQYKDDLANGYANGYYVGKPVGERTPDALDPDGDGLANVRSFVHVGTVIQDAAQPGYPEPIEDEDEEEEGNG